MTFPLLSAVTVLGETDTAITLSLAALVVAVALAVGESRWQVAHLREWKRTAEAEIRAMHERLTQLEVREGRTLERLDTLADRLGRIEEKLDRLLERHNPAA